MTEKINIEQKIKNSITLLRKAQADLKAVNSKLKNYRKPTPEEANNQKQNDPRAQKNHQGLLTASHRYNVLIEELNNMRYRSVKVSHESAVLTYGLEAEGKKNGLIMEWDLKSNFALSTERTIADLYNKSLVAAKDIASQKPGKFPSLSELNKVNTELNRIREEVAKEYKVISQIDSELKNNTNHMQRVENLIGHLDRPSTTWDEWIRSTEVI